ncbi:hypothetical protein L1049_024210 [Liquidambar formosana]|uniref:TF-B3 domain-containing protein n=1 Tax=Liquidambar formosana TaxID=63359 RepID=A0AAP0RVH3_LIQFO
MSTHVKEEEDPEANQTDSKPTCVRKRKFLERGLKRIEQSGVAPEVRRYNTRRIAATNTRKHKVFEVARRIAATNVEKRWVVKEPEFVEPKNPYFTAFISRSNRYNVNIPRSVVKKYNIKIHPDMKLRDQSGKLWPVSVVFRGDGRIAITTGWINFRKEMNLGLQDKCVFEFVLRGRISKEVRVQIFRKKTRS